MEKESLNIILIIKSFRRNLLRLWLMHFIPSFASAFILLITPFIILGTTLTNQNQSVVYYIDSVNGNDNNSGTSELSSWKSLNKINQTTFLPGDKILFKAGGIWNGKLNPKGSGKEGSPIIIDMYGSGSKPLILGGGSVGNGVVYLYNQEYWEINNLEITNDASTGGDRRGIQISASNYGIVNHIYLRKLLIHNIKGIVDQSAIEAKRTGGIAIETLDDKNLATRFNDILIEGCEIYSVDNTGIYTDNRRDVGDYPGTPDWEKRKFTNVIIRNNTIHDVAKNAMIIRLCDGGVVEFNLCYDTAFRAVTGNTIFSRSCNGTVFQFNEGYLNKSQDYDGSLYDADLQSPNTIWQYSYSHDNAHGLFWSCTVQQDSGIVCRYNISQNDRGIIFCINYPVSSIYCYNNTVYSGAGVSPTIISERNNGGTGSRKYYFSNNIIYNSSTNAKYIFQSVGYTRLINNNLFYGIHPNNEPADLNKIILDPALVNPGSGGIGLNTLDGYKLKETSPCIDRGIKFYNHSNRDFYGNPVPDKNGLIDIGAFEYQTKTSSLKNKKDELPGELKLNQNYPNPFNPDTIITYQIMQQGMVSLKVFDLLGNEKAVLVNQNQAQGVHQVRFSASEFKLASGVYFYQLRTGNYFDIKKMIVMK